MEFSKKPLPRNILTDSNCNYVGKFSKKLNFGGSKSVSKYSSNSITKKRKVRVCNSVPKVRCWLSRGDQILSKSISSSDKGAAEEKRSSRRLPFSSPVSLSSPQDDMYNIFSDEDIAVEPKIPENKHGFTLNILPESKRTSESGQKVYSNKKVISASESRIVGDLSPAKVKSAYKEFEFEAEKENIPKDVAVGTPFSKKSCHLIGFPNFGNTCYLNAVLQSVFGIPPFIDDLMQHISACHTPLSSLSKALADFAHCRGKGDDSAVSQPLRRIKEIIDRIDGSFCGFKMQDANEFLLKLLDTVKDELTKCALTSGIGESHEDDKRHHLDRLAVSRPCLQGGAALFLSSPVSEYEVPQESSKFDFSAANEATEGEDIDDIPLNAYQTLRKSEVQTRNPISDNFELKLLESYKCLGCSEVESRTQDYFTLFVDLLDSTEESSNDVSEESIQKAIFSYMKADDERDMKCDNCGNNRFTVATSISKLPRVLIIQLKRYKYNPDLSESIKISSYVKINRRISLKDVVSSDHTLPSPWSFESSLNKKANVLIPLKSNIESMKEPLHVTPQKCVSWSVEKDDTLSLDEKEEKELEEVMRRSLQDTGSASMDVDEEAEFQKAIHLSLQESGLSFRERSPEEFPNEAEVDMSEPDSDFSGDSHIYHLMSIISHFGRTTSTGHYVSDVYNFMEHKWFHYDDDMVTQVSESTVLSDGRQTNGYIFFYIHEELYSKLDADR